MSYPKNILGFIDTIFPSLTNLELDDNLLETISANELSGFIGGQYGQLTLNNNKITTIEAGAFPGNFLKSDFFMDDTYIYII